ncbi:MAG: DUF6036 family nucleotidyltransferase [Candidatus Altiarchaeota archaeon]|nr:DUF6036 family nucleotidyltransferase [Candidatus Altiarchaeota archaeon]
MPFNKKNLVEFLGIVDGELERKIELTAVGGTAMTLLDIKNSSIDMDFNLEEEHATEFKRALDNLTHGYNIDIYVNGLIFSQQLPDDYIEKRTDIETKYEKMKLYALHPLDITVTKIGRLNDRDIEDIRACIKKQKLSINEIRSRAMEVEYTGNQENYLINLRYVLEHLA